MSSLVRIAPLASLALALGCQNASQPPLNLGLRQAVWIPDAAATLAYEYYSGFGQPVRLAVADTSTWENVWAQLYRGRQPQPPLPAVDFKVERVVVASLGGRSSGGYAIGIDSVVTYELGTVVYLTGTAPGSGCGVTLAITQPVHAVRVSPPPAEPIVFQQQSVVHDCS